jgi:hypothetical protein
MPLVSSRWPWPLGAIVIAVALCTVRSPELAAQPTRRVPTTLSGLAAYPTFYHRQPVVVRATAEGDLRDVFIIDGEHRVRVLNVAPPAPGQSELLEIDGTFWDIGRLPPDDPRLAQHPIRQLAQRLFNKDWPGSGELRLLIADDTRRARDTEGTTIRTLTLEPARHRDQTVTVIGRFRGRNLYGDLPEAPGTSRTDFVLRSGAAAVWVVGKEPKGDGFDLDVMARVDTNRWLQVTGVVTGTDRLVEIDAEEITLAERPDTAAPTATLTEDRTEVGPSPEVIFSAPTQDEISVPTDTLIRVQFSRDMDADSFDGHVDITYLGADQGTEDALEFEADYQPRNRVLNISFAEPLLPYSTLVVTLEDSILASDGAALTAHTLRFSTGGS